MSPKSFVNTCDFVTSPGNLFASKPPSPQLQKTRKELGLPGGGPTTLITDLGVCEFRSNEHGGPKVNDENKENERNDENKENERNDENEENERNDENEMILTEIYPGITVEQVRAACGWPLKVASNLKQTLPPEAGVLKLLREKLDPQKLYL